MSQNIIVIVLVIIVAGAGAFGLWSDSAHNKKKNAKDDADQNNSKSNS